MREPFAIADVDELSRLIKGVQLSIVRIHTKAPWQKAYEPYVSPEGLLFPMEAHVALARRRK